MSIEFMLFEVDEFCLCISVIGVGGVGGNVIVNMIVLNV